MSLFISPTSLNYVSETLLLLQSIKSDLSKKETFIDILRDVCLIKVVLLHIFYIKVNASCNLTLIRFEGL